LLPASSSDDLLDLIYFGEFTFLELLSSKPASNFLIFLVALTLSLFAFA